MGLGGWILAARAIAIATAVTLASGCSSPPAPPAKVFILVVDETKAPVGGAELSAHSALITRTNEDGRADVEVSGRDGTTFEVDVHCPNSYRSPSSPILVRRSMDRGASPPEYVTTCNKLRHSLSVTIHVENGVGMPIRHLGKEVARTDDTGWAHLVIEGQVKERVDLLIDTSDPKFAKLHPQNPMATFEVGDKDDAQAFSMKFAIPPKPVKPVARRTGPKAF